MKAETSSDPWNWSARVPSREPIAPSRASGASAPRDSARIAAFGHAIDALRAEIEHQLGEPDADHIRRIARLSDRLELLGRGLIYVSLDPITFALGTVALWAHKVLELMEVGHMALHGAYDDLPGPTRYRSRNFHWKAPIDEASWTISHNVRHHMYTNVADKDPDLDLGSLRLSARIPYREPHAWQPFSNWVNAFYFASTINMHVTGLLDVYQRQGFSEVLQNPSPSDVRRVHRTFLKKMLRYYGREYVLLPLMAGPFMGKVLVANVLSEVGRDLFAAAIIYCGHVGARDYPPGTVAASRAHWYAMQVEASRDVELPRVLSILCGALDLQIEHHLFPRFPPNRLREIAPRVRAICAAHEVAYRSGSWPSTLRSVARELFRLRSHSAEAVQ